MASRKRHKIRTNLKLAKRIIAFALEYDDNCHLMLGDDMPDWYTIDMYCFPKAAIIQALKATKGKQIETDCYGTVQIEAYRFVNKSVRIETGFNEMYQLVLK